LALNTSLLSNVIPAKAGIYRNNYNKIPAFAGMTAFFYDNSTNFFSDSRHPRPFS